MQRGRHDAKARLSELVGVAGRKHDLVGALGGHVHVAGVVDHRQDALDVAHVAAPADERALAAALTPC